jgi:polysaccharide biosynthesis transport protein
VHDARVLRRGARAPRGGTEPPGCADRELPGCQPRRAAGSLDFRRARQTTLQERLLQIERELAGLRDRRDRLVAFYNRTGRVEVAADTATPEQRRLRELQNELASALLVFSQDNPRIRILRNQIAALETSISDQSLTATDETGAMNMFEFQLTDIEGQIEYTAAQKADIEAEIEALRISIEATPANMVTLSSLERDYANIQAQYNQAVTRRAQARVGERIEAQSRGQRITVIEPATPPEQPAKPNRRAIATAGVGGGAALGAVVALIELLKKTSARRADFGILV